MTRAIRSRSRSPDFRPLDEVADQPTQGGGHLRGDPLGARPQVGSLAAEEEQRFGPVGELVEPELEPGRQLPVLLVGVVDPELVEVAEHHVPGAHPGPVAEQLFVVDLQVGLAGGLHLPDTDLGQVHVHPGGLVGDRRLLLAEEAALGLLGPDRQPDRVLLEDGAGLEGHLVDLEQRLQEGLRSGPFGPRVPLPVADEVLELLDQPGLPVELVLAFERSALAGGCGHGGKKVAEEGDTSAVAFSRTSARDRRPAPGLRRRHQRPAPTRLRGRRRRD